MAKDVVNQVFLVMVGEGDGEDFCERLYFKDEPTARAFVAAVRAKGDPSLSVLVPDGKPHASVLEAFEDLLYERLEWQEEDAAEWANAA